MQSNYSGSRPQQSFYYSNFKTTEISNGFFLSRITSELNINNLRPLFSRRNSIKVPKSTDAKIVTQLRTVFQIYMH